MVRNHKASYVYLIDDAKLIILKFFYRSFVFHNNKKTLVLILRLFLLAILSFYLGGCINFDNNSAKLSLFNSLNKKSFSFVVSQDFIENHSNSDPSPIYPKMSIDELNLLIKFLRRDKYCINQSGDLSFKINSKQEKIYDITFLSLIEQSYNAKPVSPVTYFGECL